jgi:hypothetical protein
VLGSLQRLFDLCLLLFNLPLRLEQPDLDLFVFLDHVSVRPLELFYLFRKLLVVGHLV